MFEWLSACFLPNRSRQKQERDDLTWRIWSAGCASGEEPYSVAMLFREWLLLETVV